MINVEKMIDIGFYEIPETDINLISKYKKIFKIKKYKNITKKIRLINIDDIDICLEKLNNFLQKYDLTFVFEKDNFTHYFISKHNVIYTIVIETNNKITDMISFFIIDNTIENNLKYSQYKAGYLFYYFNESLELDELMNIALYYAKKVNIDVFNILNMFDLYNIVDKCKFLLGCGTLNYYLFNYTYDYINNDKIALTMF